MRIPARYILRPLKYLLIIVLFIAVIYYRPVIFHDNVNQYIDRADMALENRFDIVIPQYVLAPSQQPVVAQVDSKIYPEDCPVNAGNDPFPVEATATDSAELTEEELTLEPAGSVIENIDTNSEVLSVNVHQLDQALVMQSMNADKIDQSISLIEQINQSVDMMNHKLDEMTENINQPVDQVVGKYQPQAAPDLVKANKDQSKASSQSRLTPSNHAGSLVEDTQAVLLMARQSFWNGNSKLSEKIYLELARNDESNPDIYGELGNVYYAQGKWEKAGKAYYQAAVRLLDLKRTAQVDYLLKVIEGLDTESAEQLKQKISG